MFFRNQQFLDKAKIKAILINEGITMHRVVFYLAFVVDGRDKMVVAFENLKPRLHILVKIYRHVFRPRPLRFVAFFIVLELLCYARELCATRCQNLVGSNTARRH